MKCCITIQVVGFCIALADVTINLGGVFFSFAVLLYRACYSIKCQIPVTEAIVKEIYRKYSTNRVSHLDELKDEELIAAIEAEVWPLVLFIILCINQIVFNFLLIHGIRKSDIEKVKLWLVFKASIVLVGIFLILTQDSIGQGVYRQISEILYVFLTLFFMCIIFIIFDVMHRNRQHRRSLISNTRDNGDCVGTGRANHSLIAH